VHLSLKHLLRGSLHAHWLGLGHGRFGTNSGTWVANWVTSDSSRGADLTLTGNLVVAARGDDADIDLELVVTSASRL
jgi:hypothetical protein